jgi:hypothetical protein
MLRTSIIVAWIGLLCVLVYFMFVMRYYYRIPSTDDELTIIQCTADTFKADLLRERMPIVCRGVGTIEAFASLLNSNENPSQTSIQVSQDANQRIYDSLRIPGWFCRRTPAMIHNLDNTPTTTPIQSFADVALDVQLQGTRRVSLWVPTVGCEDKMPLHQVDILLSEGDGLFIPFQWWVGEEQTHRNERVQWCQLRWQNVLTGALNLNAYLGACSQWPNEKVVQEQTENNK